MTRDAFAKCAMDMERTLYRVAKTLLASDEDCADAVQEAMMKGVQAAGRLRDEQKFRPFVIRILINACRDVQRKRAREKIVELAEELPAPDGAHDLETRMVLDSLPEQERLPLVLYYLEGFSICDISGLLRVPEGTVKRRLWQARKALRLAYKEDAI